MSHLLSEFPIYYSEQLFSRIRIDEPINKPNSGTIAFWQEWQKDVSPSRLETAVDNWRKQKLN
ncbi:hypothetical protein FCM34_13790 [Aeromonas caviae]|nr:hypothetical protein FCM34_13790 [Aeromonas caviae]